MIVRAITDQIGSLPKRFRKYAFTQDDQGKLDISIGKHYIVYAIAKIPTGRQYFVHTDSLNVDCMWWMPAELYEVVDETPPKGWVTSNIEGQELWSYPSLTDWRVSEGIIDGEQKAIEQYLSEVRADPTFPSQAKLDALNEGFFKRQKSEQYEQALKLARERGWERPAKPE